MPYGKPYIGITGFMQANEVTAMAKLIPKGSKRRLMVGVLASAKTVAGKANRWPGRYPKMDDLTDIIPPDLRWDERIIPILHYASDTPQQMAQGIIDLYSKILQQNLDDHGISYRGFQYNQAWPDLLPIAPILEDSLSEETDGADGMRFVLQISKKALYDERARGFMTGYLSPAALVDKLRPYVGLVSDILIDQSAGKGLTLDVHLAITYIEAIKQAKLPFGIAVAGGLEANSLDEIRPLIKLFPDVSIDAEGRLRTPMPEDKLDLDKAGAYIEKAYSLFGKK